LASRVGMDSRRETLVMILIMFTWDHSFGSLGLFSYSSILLSQHKASTNCKQQWSFSWSSLNSSSCKVVLKKELGWMSVLCVLPLEVVSSDLLSLATSVSLDVLETRGRNCRNRLYEYHQDCRWMSHWNIRKRDEGRRRCLRRKTLLLLVILVSPILFCVAWFHDNVICLLLSIILKVSAEHDHFTVCPFF
jgi:hypothetical protein